MRAKDTQIAGNHYKELKTEPWDVVDEWPQEQQVGAYRHSALKYLMRMGRKGSMLEDAQKAKHYLAKLVEILEDEKQEEMEFRDSDITSESDWVLQNGFEDE